MKLEQTVVSPFLLIIVTSLPEIDPSSHKRRYLVVQLWLGLKIKNNFNSLFRF